METIVRAACPHDCPDTCAMLVTVKDGAATFYDCLVEVERAG